VDLAQNERFTEYLKSIKRNEVAKLVLLAVLVVSASYGGWAALRFVWATEYPVLVVVSGSMVPTLNIGDIIFIKGMPAEKIEVGTIVVFHSPREYETLVVHRVVERLNRDGTVYFRTKGDFNRYVDDWAVPKEYVVGVFSARVPYVGIIVMRLREPAGTTLIITLIVVLLAYEAYNAKTGRKTKHQ
jgi:signal peptidase